MNRPQTGAGSKPANPLVRASIDALHIDYAHTIDDGRYEDWPKYFIDPCVYQIIPAGSYAQGHVAGFFYCRSQAMLKDRVLCLRETTIHEPQSYRHVINGARILDVDGDEYRTESNFLVVRTLRSGEMEVFAAGKYLDKIVFEDDEPRFREKLVLTDSPRIDMLLAMPL